MQLIRLELSSQQQLAAHAPVARAVLAMCSRLCLHLCTPTLSTHWRIRLLTTSRLPQRGCLWAGGRPRTLCAAAKTPANKDLQRVLPENRLEVAQILGIVERAGARWDVSYSTFISPSVLADALSVLQGRSDVLVVPWGGYPQAERCRMAFGREEVLMAAREDPSQLEGAVAALQVKGNFMFDPATHRDFLGAILGTGVDRDRVGDILVHGEAGAQILVDPELVEHFETTLTQVRTVPVETRLIPLSELRVPAPKREEMRSVEASLRLDAIASAGFRMSRAKMADLIKAGDVRVNWRPASKPSVDVKAGDLISCTGKGRVEVVSITTTKKDRFAVEMVRSGTGAVSLVAMSSMDRFLGVPASWWASPGSISSSKLQQ